jgi:hypothetical protein
MSPSEHVLVACPQCHAWPMAASGSKFKWSHQSEMMFRCPRCGHHEIFNISRARLTARHPRAAAR